MITALEARGLIQTPEQIKERNFNRMANELSKNIENCCRNGLTYYICGFIENEMTQRLWETLEFNGFKLEKNKENREIKISWEEE